MFHNTPPRNHNPPLRPKTATCCRFPCTRPSVGPSHFEFRARRRDELIALRHHLEDIYQRVISAGDGELALNTEIERLQRAINDHVKAVRGRGLKFKLVDLDANLNLAPAVTAAVAYAAGLSIPLSLLTGLGAALSLKIGPSLKRHEATPTPFKYVSSYHRELF
jgi:hypothetical protein